VTTSPSGDAMTAKFRQDDELARLKQENVPWPRCWRIHPDDATRFAAAGWHCETRKCWEPVAMTTWRWWRSAEAGRVLLTEHLVCVQHGREFAERHGIDLEPAPDRPSLLYDPATGARIHRG
jgi:hypothetical protein